MNLPAPALSLPSAAPAGLTRQQKATIIVRLLQSEGIELSLANLPEDIQIALAEEMGAMRYINRATLQTVVSEFIEELDDLGLTFPRGVPGALEVIGDSLADHTAAKLRKSAGVRLSGDPWERIRELEVEKILPVLEEEAVEIGSVLLSKLEVTKSAELLGKIPGEKARRIAYGMSQTSAINPTTVHKIGESIWSRFQDAPPVAFEEGPADRVGAILNSSNAATREDVLEGLFDTDEVFGGEVKRKIFTFANIRGRVDPRDVPKITRDADADLMIEAMAFALTKEEEAKSVDYILENMSQRMAAQLKDEMEAKGKVKEADGEAAMAHVVGIIRDLEASGEITLQVEEEDGEDPQE